jgi:hypothetical protein
MVLRVSAILPTSRVRTGALGRASQPEAALSRFGNRCSAKDLRIADG